MSARCGGWLDERSVSEADTSCCACARSPRGDVPRGAREVAADDHVKQSQVVGRPVHKCQSRDVRRLSTMWDAEGRHAQRVTAATRDGRVPRWTRVHCPVLGCAHGRRDARAQRLTSSAYQQALEVIASVEPRIADATRQELADQRGSLKLIASENYASPAVLLTMGTWFSDKYAEGTIGHRFYAGCQNVDTVESIAAEHARELFGAPYAYVQPHSGIDANLVAFWSILAHRVEGPWLENARREERQRPHRRRLGEAAPRARQPAAARHVPGLRRPPDPRLPPEHQRQDVPPAAVRHRPGDRAARLRRGARRRPRSSSR